MLYLLGSLVACTLLAVGIYRKGMLDGKGSFLAALIGVLVYYFSQSFSWFILLFIFLFISFFATKYKFDVKDKLKLAENGNGRRSAVNVLANGLVFTAFAALFYLEKSEIFIAGYLAALATVTGDTLSSEIGVLSRKKPVLITTFRRVLPGTDGGITMRGELAGFLGAVIIALSAWLLGVASLKFALLACLAGGFVGFNFDSILGAAMERRHMIGNASVNFLASIAGSVVGVVAIYPFYMPA